MMNTWFECKVRYEKTMENGMQKNVTESYLVDALSFTEAEARITEKVAPFITGEFTITAIKRANISELFTTSDEFADKWIRVKMKLTTLDESSGREKYSYTHVLIQAASVFEAKERLVEGMKGTMEDWGIAMITETPILDVFKYNSTATADELR